MYPLPWHPVSCEDDVRLVSELERELPNGHVLADVEVRCLARRLDDDAVLFELVDGSGRVAEVHLTWRVERHAEWPSATVYRSMIEWMNGSDGEA